MRYFVVSTAPAHDTDWCKYLMWDEGSETLQVVRLDGTVSPAYGLGAVQVAQRVGNGDWLELKEQPR